jgi:hypothetical protein
MQSFDPVVVDSAVTKMRKFAEQHGKPDKVLFWAGMFRHGIERASFIDGYSVGLEWPGDVMHAFHFRGDRAAENANEVKRHFNEWAST